MLNASCEIGGLTYLIYLVPILAHSLSKQQQYYWVSVSTDKAVKLSKGEN